VRNLYKSFGIKGLNWNLSKILVFYDVTMGKHFPVLMLKEHVTVIFNSTRSNIHMFLQKARNYYPSSAASTAAPM
jgi:hypothetical protein